MQLITHLTAASLFALVTFVHGMATRAERDATIGDAAQVKAGYDCPDNQFESLKGTSRMGGYLHTYTH